MEKLSENVWDNLPTEVWFDNERDSLSTWKNGSDNPRKLKDTIAVFYGWDIFGMGNRIENIDNILANGWIN